MLKSLKECLGYSIKATDGEIGKAVDFLADDDLKLRYLVIDTGGWLSAGRWRCPPPGSAACNPTSRSWS